MTQLQNIQFLNAGFCSQLAMWTGLNSWKWVRFNAVVVYFEHPVHGPHLIDTGYGNAFWQATRRLPFRAYRWLVPPSINSNNCVTAGFEKRKIDANSIEAIFVSHFHPDHIAGLASLPLRPLILRHGPLEALLRLKPREQLRHGFVPDLLPGDRLGAIEGIAEDRFQFLKLPRTDCTDFRLLDYWGDGSLTLVDLPGHSLGHTGYILNGPDGPTFYVVDATWNTDVLMQHRQLPRFSRGLQSDYQQYWHTQQLLVKFARQSTTPLIACHCPRTQNLVANSKGRE